MVKITDIHIVFVKKYPNAHTIYFAEPNGVQGLNPLSINHA